MNIEVDDTLLARVEKIKERKPIDYSSKKHFVNLAVKKLVELEEASA